MDIVDLELTLLELADKWRENKCHDFKLDVSNEVYLYTKQSSILPRVKVISLSEPNSNYFNPIIWDTTYTRLRRHSTKSARSISMWLFRYYKGCEVDINNFVGRFEMVINLKSTCRCSCNQTEM